MTLCAKFWTRSSLHQLNGLVWWFCSLFDVHVFSLFLNRCNKYTFMNMFLCCLTPLIFQKPNQSKEIGLSICYTKQNMALSFPINDFPKYIFKKLACFLWKNLCWVLKENKNTTFVFLLSMWDRVMLSLYSAMALLYIYFVTMKYRLTCTFLYF